MNDKKKSPCCNRGKKEPTKILFYDFIKINGKKQEQALGGLRR